MFTITITGASATEAIADLMHAASFYRAHPELTTPEAPAVDPKPTEVREFEATVNAIKSRKPRAPTAPAAAAPPAPEPGPAAPAATEPAPVEPEVTAPAAVAETPAEPAAPAAAVTVTLEEVRAFISPLMAKAAVAARLPSLIGEFGTSRLSGIPADQLGAFLSKAKVEFA